MIGRYLGTARRIACHKGLQRIKAKQPLGSNYTNNGVKPQVEEAVNKALELDEKGKTDEARRALDEFDGHTRLWKQGNGNRH